MILQVRVVYYVSDCRVPVHRWADSVEFEFDAEAELFKAEHRLSRPDLGDHECVGEAALVELIASLGAGEAEA